MSIEDSLSCSACPLSSSFLANKSEITSELRGTKWAEVVWAAIFGNQLATAYRRKHLTLFRVRLANIANPNFRDFVSKFRVSIIFWNAIVERRKAVVTIVDALRVNLPFTKAVLLRARLYNRRLKAARGLLVTLVLSRRFQLVRAMSRVNEWEERDLRTREFLPRSKMERNFPFVFTARTLYSLNPHTLEVANVSKLDTDIGVPSRRLYSALMTEWSELSDDQTDPSAAAICFPEASNMYSRPSTVALLYLFKLEAIKQFLKRRRERRYRAWIRFTYECSKMQKEERLEARLTAARQRVKLTTQLNKTVLNSRKQMRLRQHIAFNGCQQMLNDEKLRPLVFPSEEEVQFIVAQARELQENEITAMMRRLQRQSQIPRLAVSKKSKVEEKNLVVGKKMDDVAVPLNYDPHSQPVPDALLPSDFERLFMAEWTSKVKENHTLEFMFVEKNLTFPKQWNDRTTILRNKTWNYELPADDFGKQTVTSRLPHGSSTSALRYLVESQQDSIASLAQCSTNSCYGGPRPLVEHLRKQLFCGKRFGREKDSTWNLFDQERQQHPLEAELEKKDPRSLLSKKKGSLASPQQFAQKSEEEIIFQALSEGHEVMPLGTSFFASKFRRRIRGRTPPSRLCLLPCPQQLPKASVTCKVVKEQDKNKNKSRLLSHKISKLRVAKKADAHAKEAAQQWEERYAKLREDPYENWRHK